MVMLISGQKWIFIKSIFYCVCLVRLQNSCNFITNSFKFWKKIICWSEISKKYFFHFLHFRATIDFYKEFLKSLVLQYHLMVKKQNGPLYTIEKSPKTWLILTQLPWNRPLLLSGLCLGTLYLNQINWSSYQ